MDHNAMITVIAAHRDGKQIEAKRQNWRPDDAFEWLPAIPNDFVHFEYRIKPEPPEPREWWLYLCPRHPSFYSFEGRSQQQAESLKCGECDEVIHVREVLP